MVEDRLKAGLSVDGLALESALWCRYCFGTSDAGTVIEPNDPNWERLTVQSKLAKDDPIKWLEMDDIYGSLSSNNIFAEAFSDALNSLWQNGTKATLESYIKGS